MLKKILYQDIKTSLHEVIQGFVNIDNFMLFTIGFSFVLL